MVSFFSKTDHIEPTIGKVNGDKKKFYVKDSSETTFTISDLPKEDENGNRISYSFDVQIFLIMVIYLMSITQET